MSMELVKFYRSTQKESFIKGNYYTNGVTVEELKAIGRSKADDENRNF